MRYDTYSTQVITGREPWLSRGVTGREPELRDLRLAFVQRTKLPPLILIAEHDLALLNGLTRILQRAGYRVESTTDGYETLDLARRLQPDLILTDHASAGQPGMDLLASLDGDTRTNHIPVVVMTYSPTFAQSSDRRRAVPDSYLVKPYSVEELLEVVEARLSGRSVFIHPLYRFK